MQEFEQPLYVNESSPLFPQQEFEEPLFSTTDQDFEEPLIPDKTTVVPNETLDNIFKEYGRKLTKEDINKAYLKIQKRIHPDVSPETSRLSSIVNEARDILLNEIK